MSYLLLIVSILANAVLITHSGAGNHDSRFSGPTFCYVYDHPSLFENKKLKLTATYSEGFMQTPVLSDSNCADRYIQTSFKSVGDGRSKVLVEMKRSLIKQSDGITWEAKFEFVGVLQKTNESLPINGLLDDYIFVVESATHKK